MADITMPRCSRLEVSEESVFSKRLPIFPRCFSFHFQEIKYAKTLSFLAASFAILLSKGKQKRSIFLQTIKS